MGKPNIPADAGYNISIIGRHVKITDPIRNYVFEKLEKIERIAEEIVDVHVRLEVHELQHSCSIVMQFYKHLHIKVGASADTLYVAIDKCADKVMNLIRKHKKKIQSHRAKKFTTVEAMVNVVEPQREEVEEKHPRFELHKVVSTGSMPMHVWTESEAVWRMEVSEDPFMIYRSEEDQKCKIIHRMEDGNYSIVSVV